MRILFCLLLLSSGVSAQNKFTVTYWRLDNEGDTMFYFPLRYYLVVHDSSSYTYTENLKMPTKNNIPLGSAFRSHAEYRNMKENLVVFNAQVSGYGRLLVLDTIRKIDWEKTNESKTVSGFHCKKAIGVENGQQLTVWYTTELPAGHGPFTPQGLPGTILEIYYRNYDFTVTAIEVKNSAEHIVAPSKGKAVTRERYDKMVKSIYRGPRPRVITTF